MRVAYAAAAALLAIGPGAVRAQVLEVGDDGRVAVYDRPAVFTDAGVAPVRPDPAPASRAALATRAAPAEVRREIADAATAYSLDARLLDAVAWQESRFRHDALSPKGAQGVMQLMPATARALGVDARDLRQNVRGGAAYLAALLGRFGGDVAKGLAAYNAGPGAVERFGGVPPFAETKAYVASILGRLSPVTPVWEGTIK